MGGALKPEPEFWRGRRVLVTGHTGFKGSWLCLWLQGMGAEVVGVALPPDRGPNLFDLAGVANGMRSIQQDIRDAAAVRRILAETAPEIVLHLAAQSLVRRSYADPIETYATNVMGTLHVLEAVRAVESVRAVLVVTSDKCYENREWHWPYREIDALGGLDPYSSSKGCAEVLVDSYRRSFFGGPRARTAIASARAGNVVGGGDFSADRLVPDLVRGAVAGRPVVIRNPVAVRPWQHVAEPLAGYLMLAERLVEEGSAVAEAWNFGPASDDHRTVADLADRFVARWGAGAAWERDAGVHPHEAGLLALDSAKAHVRLGWRPRWRFEETVERTLGWYRLWADGADPEALRSAATETLGAWANGNN